VILTINQVAIGGFEGGCYWSSEKDGADQAWTQQFSSGSFLSRPKKYGYLVRAVRAFKLSV